MTSRRKNAEAFSSIAVDPEWEARHALDLLHRAEEIKANPRLMSAVRRHAAKHQKATAKILKSAAKPRKETH